MKTNRWVLFLVACLAFATAAEAQGPGGGRRGFGGFGGGFGGGGGAGGLFFLLNNEAVQKELALSSDAMDKAKTLGEEFGAAIREAMAADGPPNFREMSEDERAKAFAKMAETGRTVSAKFLPKLKEVLSADQFTRLQQINWQNMGTGALSDPEVVKALTITKEETAKIAKLNEEYREKAQEFFTPGAGREGFAKMRELNQEKDGKIMDVLTKDQQEAFATLKGAKFDVEQLRLQFGGRGPGGPGGGPGGGGGGRPKRPQPKAE